MHAEAPSENWLASGPTRPTRRVEDPPAVEGGVIAAGNASQFSDGASACIVMDAKTAASRKLKPLGVFRGFAVAGCEPTRWGLVRCSRCPSCSSAPA